MPCQIEWRWKGQSICLLLVTTCRNEKGRDKIEHAVVEINSIKTKHAYLSKFEQKAFLQSVGYGESDFLSSDEESDNEEDDDGGYDVETSDEEEYDIVDFNTNDNLANTQEKKQDQNKSEHSQLHFTPVQSTSSANINSPLVLGILRDVEFNWFSFVVLLEPKFINLGYSVEVFDQFLADFTEQLPNLGLSEDELRLADQSRLAYFSEGRRIQEIIDESSDEEVGYQGEEMSEEMVRQKLKLINDKGKRRARRE